MNWYLSVPQLSCYGLDIKGLFTDFRQMVGSDEAAATLTLAHVNANPQDERPLTTAQAADVLGVSRQSVHHLCQSGQLRSIKVGKAIRIRREWLDSYMAPKPRKSRHW